MRTTTFTRDWRHFYQDHRNWPSPSFADSWEHHQGSDISAWVEVRHHLNHVRNPETLVRITLNVGDAGNMVTSHFTQTFKGHVQVDIQALLENANRMLDASLLVTPGLKPLRPGATH